MTPTSLQARKGVRCKANVWSRGPGLASSSKCSALAKTDDGYCLRHDLTIRAKKADARYEAKNILKKIAEAEWLKYQCPCCKGTGQRSRRFLKKVKT